MRLSLRARLLTAAVTCAAVPASLAVPAEAQLSVDISFDSFHDRLAAHGAWVYSDRWGTVWQPSEVAEDFRPYDTGGHWEYTDEYGWLWASDYDWGDVTFHYGRWVDDPDDGWMWIPGYVWSPAWVVWRGNDRYTGWMPMPPDENFISGRGDVGFTVSWSDPDRYYTGWYGAGFAGRGSMWVFVNTGHIADRDFHRYTVERTQVPTLVRQTVNITHYTVVNNYVVNRSVDPQVVARFAGHPIRPVAARLVIRHPEMVATVGRGEQVRIQMLREVPRGNGKPNSAPPPPPAIVSKLSDRPAPHGPQQGHPSHLFSKSTLSQPGAESHFRGSANAGTNPPPAPGTPAGANPSATSSGGKPEAPNDAGPGTPARRMHINGAQTPSPPTGNPGPDATPQRMPHETAPTDNAAPDHGQPLHHNPTPETGASPDNTPRGRPHHTPENPGNTAPSGTAHPDGAGPSGSPPPSPGRMHGRTPPPPDATNKPPEHKPSDQPEDKHDKAKKPNDNPPPQ